MKDKNPILMVIFALTFLFCSSVPSLAQDEAEDEITIKGMNDEELNEALDRWRYDYVRYIITGWEEEEWGNLKTTTDKIKFIEYFWKMRDPDLKTEENEYREEFRDRWNYVNKKFTAGKHGWRTDRGRIYLLLGAPNDIQRNPMGRDRSERPSEIWYYNNAENPKLPAQIEIAFVDFMGYGDYEIVSDLDRTARMFSERFGISMNNLDAYGLRRAGEVNLADDAIVSRMFDETVIRNPEILSTDLFDLQDELRYVAEVPHLKVRKASERIRTEIATADLTFDIAAHHFKGTNGEMIVPVTLNIPLSKVSYVLDPATGRNYQIALYARLHNDNDNLTFEDNLTIPVTTEMLRDPQQRDRLDNYRYQFLFVAPAGEYTLNITLRDELSKNVGFVKDNVNLVPASDTDLGISSIILADLVERMNNSATSQAGSMAPFKVADRRVIPNVAGEIDIDTQTEFYLFFHIRNFGLSPESGKPDLSVQYFIYKNGQLISKTKPAKVSSPNLSRAVVESQFNSKALGTGKFRIIAEVTDAVSDQKIKDEISFEIIRSKVIG